MQVIRVVPWVLCACLFAAQAQARQPIFFSVYGGGTTFTTDEDFAGPLVIDQEEDGYTWGAGAGYEITDRWILQLDYTRTDADDVVVDQVFLSINYKFPFLFSGMHGLVGIVGGEGSLEWDDVPEFADPLRDDTDVDQSLYGIQLGLEYDISDSWSTSLKYHYYDQEFKSHVDTVDFGRARFSHDEFQYVLFGLHYHF